MKYFYIEGQLNKKLNWFTIKLLFFKLSIATLGIKKFSLRFTIEWGW